MTTESVAHLPRLAYRMDEAAKISGLSQSTLFLHIQEGRLKSVRVGGRRLIHACELRRFIQIEEVE